MMHKARLLAAAILVAVTVGATLIYGLDYYRMDAGDRVFSVKHDQLRPSGTIGLKLGMLGVAGFLALYAYPLRKRWKWLQRFGKTRNWLDFHILLGVSIPILITLHSSFKFQGLAGVAYWLMIAVMASGFVGRYIYAQIPKSLNEMSLTLEEIAQLIASSRSGLAHQHLLDGESLERILNVPEASRVEHMSVPAALAAMIWRDIRRPFQTAALRRSSDSSVRQMLRSLFGFRSSGNVELESAIHLARRQSRLVAKMAFLGRANQLFQLWHVVHRPFSYSFAVLAIVHVALVMLMGFF